VTSTVGLDCVKTRERRVFRAPLLFPTSRKRRSERSERSSVAKPTPNLRFYTAWPVSCLSRPAGFDPKQPLNTWPIRCVKSRHKQYQLENGCQSIQAFVRLQTDLENLAARHFSAQGWRCSKPCGRKITDGSVQRAQRAGDDEDQWADRQDLKSFDRISNTTIPASESLSINPRG
jgi:hypothetical protein